MEKNALNQIICGDAVNEMRRLSNASVDLVIADPPYNLGKDYGNNDDTKPWHEYERFTIEWLAEVIRILKPTGSVYVFMGFRFISRLCLLMEDKFKLQF